MFVNIFYFIYSADEIIFKSPRKPGSSSSSLENIQWHSETLTQLFAQHHCPIARRAASASKGLDMRGLCQEDDGQETDECRTEERQIDFQFHVFSAATDNGMRMGIEAPMVAAVRGTRTRCKRGMPDRRVGIFENIRN